MDRNYSIDTIKFFASFSVVGIHIGLFSDINYELYLFINTLFRLGVPFFFASSGYLLHKKTYNNIYRKNYLIKYIKNIVKILIIISLIYILEYIIRGIIFSVDRDILIQELKSIFSIKTIYYGYEKMSMYHLWYLVAIIYIVPIIYIFRNKLNKLLIISLILNIIGIIIQAIYPIYIFRDALFFGLFYTTLGYWISENEVKISKKLINIKLSKLYLNLILVVVIQFCERVLVEKLFNGGGDYFLSTIFATTILMYIIIKDKNILKNTTINKIGIMSMGIYLIHVMLINYMDIVIYKLKFNSLENTIIGQCIFAIIIFSLSYYIYNIFNIIFNKYIKNLSNKVKFKKIVSINKK